MRKRGAAPILVKWHGYNYPLVSIQKTLEDQLYQWASQLFLWPCSIAMLVITKRVHHNFAKGWKILCQAIVKIVGLESQFFPKKYHYGLWHSLFFTGPWSYLPILQLPSAWRPSPWCEPIFLEAIDLLKMLIFHHYHYVKNYQTLPLATPNQPLNCMQSGFLFSKPTWICRG